MVYTSGKNSVAENIPPFHPVKNVVHIHYVRLRFESTLARPSMASGPCTEIESDQSSNAVFIARRYGVEDLGSILRYSRTQKEMPSNMVLVRCAIVTRNA